MIDPTPNDLERQVVYAVGTDRQDEGVITGFNPFMVFVKYKGDNHSKGTRREDLSWSHNDKQSATTSRGE